MIEPTQHFARRPPAVDRAKRALGSCKPSLDCTSDSAEKNYKLFNADSGFADEGSKSALREFPMIWHGEPAIRWPDTAKNDMAPLLPIDLVSKATKRGDGLTTRDPRQRAQTATSITSSRIDGGMGSPRSRRLSR